MSDTVINDPIHGSIRISPLCVQFLNTPQIQRLRNIKQLGVCDYVYPGATHTRFEHSIGVCYLAGKFARHLNCKIDEDMERFKKEKKDKERKELETLKMSIADILCIEIAGLCHDLGQGPFSRLFDQEFYKDETISKDSKIPATWTPRNASQEMFDHIVEKNTSLKKKMMDTFEAKTEEQLKNFTDFIKDLITGKVGDKPAYMYQIVTNKEYEIDVDKMDYFTRDCHGLGLTSGFDIQRYMLMSKVMMVNEGETRKSAICIRYKARHYLYEVFLTRYKLFQRAYFHKVAKGIEYMVVDALVAANTHITFNTDKGESKKMSDACTDMSAYEKLSDGILSNIMFSNDTKLQMAKDLVTRINHRDLYTCLHESTPSDITIDTKQCHEQLVAKGIDPSDFLIKTCIYSFSKHTDNPIKNVYFFKKTDVDKCFNNVKPEKVFKIIKFEKFREETYRIYSKCKREEEHKITKLKNAISEIFD